MESGGNGSFSIRIRVSTAENLMNTLKRNRHRYEYEIHSRIVVYYLRVLLFAGLIEYLRIINRIFLFFLWKRRLTFWFFSSIITVTKKTIKYLLKDISWSNTLWLSSNNCFRLVNIDSSTNRTMLLALSVSRKNRGWCSAACIFHVCYNSLETLFPDVV